MPIPLVDETGSVVVREDQDLPRIAESVPAVIGLAGDPGADELRLAVVFPCSPYASPSTPKAKVWQLKKDTSQSCCVSHPDGRQVLWVWV
jgi:hypothetical protein